MARIIPLDSVRNFRDFGGYTTQSGQTIKYDYLFRAAHFSDLNDTDQAALSNMEIGLLVDLRHGPERQRQPNKTGIASKSVYELDESAAVKNETYAPHEMFLKEKLETAEDARNYMISSYTARPHDPVFIDIFSKTLSFMAKDADPFVIHCAAGKDRTGTLAAIIHKALGVSDEDVMSDYLLTMQAVDIESFLEPAAKIMSNRFGRPVSPDALRPMFGVEPDFLKASLDAIGEFDDYISQILNISDNDCAAIKHNYLKG